MSHHMPQAALFVLFSLGATFYTPIKVVDHAVGLNLEWGDLKKKRQTLIRLIFSMGHSAHCRATWVDTWLDKRLFWAYWHWVAVQAQDQLAKRVGWQWQQYARRAGGPWLGPVCVGGMAAVLLASSQPEDMQQPV